MAKTPSKSKELKIGLLYAAMQALKEAGGELPSNEVVQRVEQKVKLDDWAKERYAKTGYRRWVSILHFYSIYAIKAGYIVKKHGVWYLTPEGEKALHLGESELFHAARAAYQEWRAQNPRNAEPEEGDEETTENETLEHPDLDTIEQQGRESIKSYIQKKNGYEFQEVVAALLRGMGYYTPFVAPRGKDGGVDIVAYRDPLGSVTPRIKVQVKHRMDTPTRVEDIRSLMGLLQKDGDVGMFIATGGFTNDARGTARSSHVHVELIDLDRFIELWINFYDKMTDEDKRELPLRPVYFLAPAE